MSFCLLGNSILDIYHRKINNSISHCLLERDNVHTRPLEQRIKTEANPSSLSLQENFCFIALKTGSFLTGRTEGLAKECLVAVEFAVLPALLRLRRPGKTQCWVEVRDLHTCTHNFACQFWMKRITPSLPTWHSDNQSEEYV